MIVAGVSHRTAPVEVRERLVYAPPDADAALASLREGGHAREAVLLSTCNRTELYVVEGNDGQAAPHVWRAFTDRLGADPAPYAYVHRDRQAIVHLFRVAAGLDSMILGEAQIHGQVRDAWEASRQHAGAALNRAFQAALQVSGRVRHETALARGAASVSSASVQLAKQIFGSLRGRRAMVLGAGEMAELALECLVREGVHAAVVANRTFTHADELAQRYGAEAVHFDECWRRLADVDLLICSTAAPHPVVSAARVRDALARRGDEPLCVLDIALPRDVEPAVGKLENVFLYDLDDLQAVVTANLERRQGEVPAAERLVTSEAERYWQWLAGLAAVPSLTELRARMEETRAEELARALQKLDALGPLAPAQREAVEHLSRTLMNKFLHEPSVRLREAAANGRGLAVVDAARFLFALDGGQDRRSGHDRRGAQAHEAGGVDGSPTEER